MIAGLTGWHLVILVGVVLLLFGTRKLPDMARAVGQSARILKSELKEMTTEDHPRPEGAGAGAARDAEESAAVTDGVNLRSAVCPPAQPTEAEVHRTADQRHQTSGQ